jgi:hypothetical protein
MVDMHSMLVSMSRWGVTFLVPAVVWVTLMAGLLQLVFGSIRRLGITLPRSTAVRAKVGAASVTQS